jgi:hypothetical protein
MKRRGASERGRFGECAVLELEPERESECHLVSLPSPAGTERLLSDATTTG